ncbi:helix-turn-helix domain-containing protein [Dactylosporangium sp. NPDC051484]|uniref:helix-turn-helix domain-containing protein n=1 Tax=Dactylosporangium sp. NPDC051484 TaxID=3154942 RepID=UPI00344BF0DA
MLSGVDPVEACRWLGIRRKTGYRWRVEHGGLALAALSENVRSRRYLSLPERRRIATLRRDGLGVRQIGQGAGPFTVDDQPGVAPRSSWSPEQIAAWLHTTFPDRTDWHVCHEATHQAIYAASSLAGCGADVHRRDGAAVPPSDRPGSSTLAGSSTSDWTSSCAA